MLCSIIYYSVCQPCWFMLISVFFILICTFIRMCTIDFISYLFAVNLTLILWMYNVCTTNIDISTFVQAVSKPLSVFMRSCTYSYQCVQIMYIHISIYRKSFWMHIDKLMAQLNIYWKQHFNINLINI